MTHRVLVFGEYGSLNGGENSFLAIAPSLIRHQFEFFAAVPAGSEFAFALNAIGIETVDLPWHHADGTRKTQTEIRDSIEETIRDLSPDLVHCNSLSTSRLVGPTTHELAVPSLGYLRDILKLSKKAVNDINLIDRIIAVSQATKDWHGGQGLDLSRAHVVYNGVDARRFRPATSPDNSIRNELGIRDDAPVILFVGQIGMRKGVDVLMDAFLTIAARNPDVHLLIVGQRHSQKQEALEYEARLIERSRNPVLRNRIHWLGSRLDVDSIMRNSTLLVHPARQEPLGRVLLEAAASGLPIITTAVGGSAEILQTLNSLLVPKDDVDSMVNRVSKLLDDPELIREISGTLRTIALRDFPVERCATQIRNHYQQLIES